MSTFDKDERALIDKLRNKYAPQGHAPIRGTGAEVLGLPDASTPAESDAACRRVRAAADNIDVRQCAVCQGSGMQVEVYEHRRLEHTCTGCCGRGVLVLKDGAEVQGEADIKGAEQQTDASKERCVLERIRELERDGRQLTSQLDKYSQEKEQLQQSLKQEGVPEQQQQLTATLVKQIERQIAKLQRMLTKKQHELSQLKQPISISDIIANEC